VHLILAHLRRVVELFPDIRAYAEMAWMVILGDMLVLIWYLMFVGPDQVSPIVGIVLLLGLAAVSWCSEPQGSPVKRILTGFASAILPLLGTFSDIMSYIRLFAVGLASYYIADAFNGLGAQVAQSATWLAGAPIVIFGHALNLGLAAIAIFAHGVRLNMLEFSNNVGVKWAGYAYQPFAPDQET
jgi:V/A-type H+-transporting ATPase subunit I